MRQIMLMLVCLCCLPASVVLAAGQSGRLAPESVVESLLSELQTDMAVLDLGGQFVFQLPATLTQEPAPWSIFIEKLARRSVDKGLAIDDRRLVVSLAVLSSAFQKKIIVTWSHAESS